MITDIIGMIAFSPPRIDNKIIEEVTDTLNSGWITTGPKVKLFEKRLAEYCQSKRVLAVNSATAGLELMLRWFGVGPDDEVIVPAYTYTASASIVLHCGAKLVMVDTDIDSFNISVDNIRKAITPKTKVIIPVDIGGVACDYDSIMSLVKSDEIKSVFTADNDIQKQLGRIFVLSDSAHSIGGKYKSQPTGSLADVSVFSFHAVKNLTTAEGGAISFNLPDNFDQEEIYKYLNIWTLHGQSKDALAKSKKGAWRYDVIMPGYKMNMTDIMASIGLVELSRYDSSTLVKREELFNRYYEVLSEYPWAILPIGRTEEVVSSFHLFMLRVKNCSEDQRDRIIQGVFDREVSVNVHFVPLPMLSCYKALGFEINDYPNAFNMYKNEISLPLFFDLTLDEVDIVCKAVVESVEEVLGKC